MNPYHRIYIEYLYQSNQIEIKSLHYNRPYIHINLLQNQEHSNLKSISQSNNKNNNNNQNLFCLVISWLSSLRIKPVFLISYFNIRDFILIVFAMVQILLIYFFCTNSDHFLYFICIYFVLIESINVLFLQFIKKISFKWSNDQLYVGN